MRHANAPARTLAFPSLAGERERSRRLFDIDIEQSFRDWMEQLGADPDVQAHGEPTPPDWRTLDLSQRERECLTLLACGYSKEEAGAILHISMETVKSHTRRVNQRMGVKSFVHATFIAALVGELDVELLQEHLFRTWESPGLTAPRRPVAA